MKTLEHEIASEFRDWDSTRKGWHLFALNVARTPIAFIPGDSEFAAAVAAKMVEAWNQLPEVRYRRPADEMPDADVEVIGHWPEDANPEQPCSWDGEVWRDFRGAAFVTAPACWCHYPVPPESEVQS